MGKEAAWMFLVGVEFKRPEIARLALGESEMTLVLASDFGAEPTAPSWTYSLAVEVRWEVAWKKKGFWV